MNDKPSDLVFDVGAHRGDESGFYLKPASPSRVNNYFHRIDPEGK